MLAMQRKIDAGSPNRTGAATESYRNNWESIFGKKKSTTKTK